LPFHGLQKDMQRTVLSVLLQKPCPFIHGTAVAHAASLPHPAGILRVPEMSSAIPFLAPAHFSTRTRTTNYTVGSQEQCSCPTTITNLMPRTT
jgi:hypothetical protein